MYEWIWSRLYPWRNLTHRQNWLEKKHKRWWWWRGIYFFFGHLFISSIELSFIIITKYLYASDIWYYSIMTFILQHLCLCIILLYTSQRSLVFLCSWCIWLHKTLFQTRQWVVILSKDSICDSMNILSTGVQICNWIQISNSQLLSPHGWYYQQCKLTVPR